MLHPIIRIGLDLQHLQTFYVVATMGSFSRAATALGYSQSNVTHQIKTLERKLGVALLDRYRFSRHAILTEAGHRILKHSEHMLDLANRMLSKDGMALTTEMETRGELKQKRQEKA